MSDETTTPTAPEATTEPTAPAPEAAQPAKPPLTHAGRKQSAWDRIMAEQSAAAKPAEEPAKEPEATETPEAKEPEAAVPKSKEEPKPKEQTTQEKADAKAFAALAREKKEARELRDAATQSEARAQQALAAAQEKERAAEARMKEATATAEKVMLDPDAFFDHFVKLTGIRDMKALSDFAAKRWQRPAEPAPGARPLTEADLQRRLEEDRKTQSVAAARAQGEKDFEKLFELPDDDAAAIKYPAASLGWTREKRIAEGHKLADTLTRLGKQWTLESLADAIDEMAKQDPDVQKKLKKLGKTTSAPAGGEKKPATQSKSPTAAQTPAAPTVPAPKPNGAAKLSHKDRFAALLETTRKGT